MDITVPIKEQAIKKRINSFKGFNFESRLFVILYKEKFREFIMKNNTIGRILSQ